MAKYIKIHPADDVALALENISEGSIVEGISIPSAIPSGHKIALRPMSKGENVLKYGMPIGHLVQDVAAGGIVDHSKLVTNLEGLSEYIYTPVTASLESEALDEQYFMGYRRKDGQVGIRNEIWIIPTVGCVNGIATELCNSFRSELSDNMGNVDAIVAFPHNYGCSQLGCDHVNTRTILSDMVHHPNAGAVLVIALGCENNQLSAFREHLGSIDEDRVSFLEVQKVEGDEIEAGLFLLRELFKKCSSDKRVRTNVSELKVGLKCGGSDGLSGVTANPLAGAFSDWLTARGGTTVLTEVPEMFGAETLLMNRCVDRKVFDKTVSLINDFKEYFMKSGQPVYENPSPGNKAGGISTLEEKSLGCTQKSGSSQVMDVLKYGERLSTKGLNLLCAPGNDLVASTALAASGCQMILFTTGRGTPFGSMVPTVKISTNTPLSLKKPGWIDFNAGVIAEGQSIPVTAAILCKKVLSIASGEWVNNEKKAYREMAIFKTGVTL